MKAYKLEILIIDHDNLGIGDIKDVLENTHYSNYCIAPVVMNIEGRDIGEWTDEHPLNSHLNRAVFYKKLFEN